MTRRVPDATSRTDGDIVLRGVAAGRAPYATTAGPHALARRRSRTGRLHRPDHSTDRAAELMRRHAVRRFPVGVGTLGDLAATDAPHSAPADISRGLPND